MSKETNVSRVNEKPLQGFPTLATIRNKEFRKYTGPVEIIPDILYRINSDGIIHKENCEGYALIDKKGTNGTNNKLILIDPGGPNSINRFKDNLRLLGYSLKDIEWILLTHSHLDHFGLTQEILNNSNAEVGALEEAKSNIEDPEVDLVAPIYGSNAPAARVHRTFKDGEIFKFGSLSITFLSTPGHSPDSTTLRVKVNNHDLFFNGDLPKNALISSILGSNYDQWNYSLDKVIRLITPESLVFSGHDLPMNGVIFKEKNRILRPKPMQEFEFMKS